MEWLKYIQSWAEVRRLLLIITPIGLLLWAVIANSYSKKLEDNIKEVKIEQALDKMSGQIADLDNGVDSLSRMFNDYRSQDIMLTDQMQKQIDANYKSFIFSVEYQGKMTRSAMLEFLTRVSATSDERIMSFEPSIRQTDLMVSEDDVCLEEPMKTITP